MSGNLNLPALTGGQANPETTSNDADAALESALTDVFEVDISGGDVTLTSAQYRTAMKFSITGGTAPQNVTLPVIARPAIFESDAANTDDVTLTRGSAVLTLSPGDAIFVYTDGTTNGLIAVAGGVGGGGTPATGKPYDLANYVPGLPAAGATVLRFNVVRAFTLLATLPGSLFNAGVAATATAVFTIKQNGSSVGTLSYAAAGTVPTVTFASDVTFAVNDVLEIFAPGSQDSTLANISFNFFGSRAADTGLESFDMGIFIPGKPLAAGTVLRFNVVREFILEAGLSASLFSAGVASAASKVFNIKQNGSSIGSVTFATSATGAATFASTVHFAVDDLVEIIAPAVQDSTLADIALNFFGSR